MTSVAIAVLISLNARLEDHVDRSARAILTYRQYAAIPHKTPYILEFKAGSGALLLYGAEHTGNFEDPQIADIEKRWKEFKPTVAYNEGGNPPTLGDPKKAVGSFGEPGLLRYLAGRDEVPVATFEPPFSEEIDSLRSKYSPEQIKVFYALRQVAEARRLQNGPPVDEILRRWLAGYLPSQGLNNAPTTLDEFTASCKRLFPTLADWHNVSDDWFDPTQALQYTNQVANDTGSFRDRFIFRTVVRRAERGDRVFAVIGEAHVVVQEPALVMELGKPVLKVSGL